MKTLNFKQPYKLVALYDRIPTRYRMFARLAPSSINVSLDGIKIRVGYTVHNTPVVFASRNGLDFYLGFDNLGAPAHREISMNRPWVYLVDSIPEHALARHRDLPIVTYKGWSVREGRDLTGARIVIVELAESDLKLLLCIDRVNLYLDSGFGGGFAIQHRTVFEPPETVTPAPAAPVPRVTISSQESDKFLADVGLSK